MAQKNGSEYLALARKYRPQKFEDVVGQEHVLKALEHSIEASRTHHAYLLTGTRGIGKTTIARIFAKALDCEQGVSAHPCGECNACKNIAEGVFPDVIEIDAASQTKVDDTRQLLENTQYPPMSARYKIYIIDEVHMLTTNSFNALLKTLEEPPSYVKFILATTDPHKIPTTVLSRCLQFQLRALNIDEIEHQLANICQKEQIEFEKEALTVLARAARGSMRDALSLCDQAIALGGGTLKAEQIYSMLGTVGDVIVNDIFELLASRDQDGSDVGTNFGSILEKIRSKAPNYKSLLDELVIAFHDLALYQLIGGTRLEVFSFNCNMLENFARRIPAAQIQLYYQIVLEGLQEYPYAADGRSAFEMTLLRLLAFTPEKKKTWIGELDGVEVDFLDELVNEVRRTTTSNQRERLVASSTAMPQVTGSISEHLDDLLQLSGSRQKNSVNAALSALKQEARSLTQNTTVNVATDSSQVFNKLEKADSDKLYALINNADSSAVSFAQQLCVKLNLNEQDTKSIVDLTSVLSANVAKVQQVKEKLAQVRARNLERAKQQAEQQYKQDSNNSQEHNPFAYPEHINNQQSTVNEVKQFGQGPNGSFGEGFTLPSPQERSQAVLEKKATTNTVVEQNTVSAIQTDGSFSGRKTNIEGTADLNTMRAQLEQMRNSGIEVQSSLVGANSEFAKTINRRIEEENARFEATRAHYMALVPRVVQYLKDLEKSTNELFAQKKAVNKKGSIDDVSAKLSTVTAKISYRRERLNQGLPALTEEEIALREQSKLQEIKQEINPQESQLATQIVNGDATNLSVSEDNFSLEQQGINGFDVNDKRHLGSQLVSSISLENNDASIAPGGELDDDFGSEHGSVIVKDDVPVNSVTNAPNLDLNAPVAEQNKLNETDNVQSMSTTNINGVDTNVISENNLSVVDKLNTLEQSNIANDSIHDIIGKSSLQANVLDTNNLYDANIDNTVVKHSEQVGRTLDSMRSQMLNADRDSFSKLSINISDITGSSTSSDSILSKIDPNHKEQGISIADTPLDVVNAAQVQSDSCAVNVVAHKSDTTADFVQNNTSQGSLETKASDSLLSNDHAFKSTVDSFEAGKAAISATIADFKKSQEDSKVKGKVLTEEERLRLKKEQHDAAFASLDQLDNIYTTLEKEEKNLEPSPWVLIDQDLTITVDGNHIIKLKHPERPKPKPFTGHNNFLVNTSNEKEYKINTYDIECNPMFGHRVDIHDLGYIEQLKAQEQKNIEDIRNNEQRIHDLLESYKQQGVDYSALHNGILQLEALRNEQLARSLYGENYNLEANNIQQSNINVQANNYIQQQNISVEDNNQYSNVALAKTNEQQVVNEQQGCIEQTNFTNQPFVNNQEFANTASINTVNNNAVVIGAVEHDPYVQNSSEFINPTNSDVPSYINEVTQVNDYVSNSNDYVDERPDYIADQDEAYESSFDVEAQNMSAPLSDNDFVSEADSDDVLDTNTNFAIDNFIKDEPKTTQVVDTVGAKTVHIANMALVDNDDFYDDLYQKDEWYRLIKDCIPENLHYFISVLCASERHVDTNNKNHWHIYISNDDDMSNLDPKFWSNVQNMFEQKLGVNLIFDIIKQPQVPAYSPQELTKQLFNQKLMQARVDLGKNIGIKRLLEVTQESLEHVGIELYKKVD